MAVTPDPMTLPPDALREDAVRRGSRNGDLSGDQGPSFPALRRRNALVVNGAGLLAERGFGPTGLVASAGFIGGPEVGLIAGATGAFRRRGPVVDTGAA